MRALSIWAALALFGLTACTTTSTTDGGSGSAGSDGTATTAGKGGIRYVATSCPFAADVALKITNAPSHLAGVAAEYDWIGRNLPGWTRDGQALRDGPGGRTYDVLYLVKGGQKKTVCFDITDFWKYLAGF